MSDCTEMEMRNGTKLQRYIQIQGGTWWLVVYGPSYIFVFRFGFYVYMQPFKVWQTLGVFKYIDSLAWHLPLTFPCLLYLAAVSTPYTYVSSSFEQKIGILDPWSANQ